MRTVEIDKHGVLSAENGIVECPIRTTLECDVSCNANCAWFSISAHETYVSCHSETIGKLVRNEGTGR